MQNPIAHNITQLFARISSAEKKFKRIPGIVQLVAVSKTRTANDIRKAVAAGVQHVGENYLQEALAKKADLQDLSICWHFIGPIQSNKTAEIAAHFDWVHSLDRSKIAQRLSDQRPAALAPLNVCLQVNISDEASKSGVALDALEELAAKVAALPHLHLRGLMTIPSPDATEAQLRTDYARMRQALDLLNTQGFELDTLSMGMSDDLECAIAEGATFVRIGTAIFGPRN